MPTGFDAHKMVVAGLIHNMQAVEYYSKRDYPKEIFYDASERTEMSHGIKQNLFLAHCAVTYYDEHAELAPFSFIIKMLKQKGAKRARIAAYKKRWHELVKHKRVKLGEWKERLKDLILEYREHRHKDLTVQTGALYSLPCLGNCNKKEEKCRLCPYQHECKLMIDGGVKDRSIWILDWVASQTEQIKLDTLGTRLRIYNVTDILQSGITKLHEDIAELDENGNIKIKGIVTPFKKLTKDIGGWMNRRLYVVGSRSGVGKSAFLLQCGNVAASANNNVLYFNLEMPVLEELRYRIISYLCGAPFEELMTKQVSKETLSQIEEGIEHWIKSIKEKDNYQIIDIPLQTKLSTIFRMVDNYIARKGNKNVLVIIDYFNLLYVPPNVKRPDVHWGQMSQQLHSYARLRNIPILTAVQLNRSAEGAKRATAKHLRDADCIMDNIDGFWCLMPLSEALLRFQCVKGRYFTPHDYFLHKQLWKMGFAEFKKSEESKPIEDSEDDDETQTSNESDWFIDG